MMYSDPEYYWHRYSKQEHSANKLFTFTIGLVWQVEDGTWSIIDFGIEFGHLERMYHKGLGLFYIPPVETPQLHSLHALALGILKVSYPIFKGELISGQLTNERAGPQD